MIKLTEEQIIDGQNEAYLKAGYNAYFGNGFNAGVEFALKQVNKLPIQNDNCTFSYTFNAIGLFYTYKP